MSAAVEETNGTVERLREQIRKLQAAPRSYVSVLRTGIAPFDAVLPGGGFPLGHAIELCGEAASGRTSLALRAMAAATREQRLTAYIDGPRELYPPAAAALGVELTRMLVVRPKAPGQLVWTAVQLLRSGAFCCVGLDLSHTGVRLGLAEAKKLQDAAAKGGALLLLLTPPDAPGDGLVRLRISAAGIDGLHVEVVRSRQGKLGERVQLPWAALYPNAAPQIRYLGPKEQTERVRVPTVSAAYQPEPVEQHFHRIRSSAVRNGDCGSGIRGLTAQRPGRDIRFPPMEHALGGAVG